MPFEVAESVRGKSSEAMASVSYCRYITKKSKSKPRLIIGLPGAAVEGLNLDKMRFAVAFGTGADAGKTRIVIKPDGAPAAKARGGGATIRFGHIPALGDDAGAKEFTPFRRLDPKKDGAIIELQLAWLKPEA